MNRKDNYSVYFRGEALYGDDFSREAIEQWHEDEKEGYADLSTRGINEYLYEYHAINELHGFRYLSKLTRANVLGIGSAFGHEFEPLRQKIKQITIIEPSDKLISEEIAGVKPTYVKPTIMGNMPFEDGTFDLVVSLGVLHHIPNVSHVLSEISRVLKSDGYAVIREPIVTMGDWRKSRTGLTKHERGIPLKLFRKILEDNGLRVKNEKLCFFAPGLMNKMFNPFLKDFPYNVKWYVRLDGLLSNLFAWNVSYHRENSFKKLAASSVFFLTKKSRETLQG